MSLDATIRASAGALRLDLELRVARREVVAILGPNGAGKTTLLKVLAGLHPLETGHVRLEGRVLDDTEAAIHVPPERRPVGVVFQDYLLFPHLSCLENVAFGLRRRGVKRADARSRAGDWLDRVGLAARASARPPQLSGGEAQRVALARALVTEPVLLLLDEPLSALDIETRAALRRDMTKHLASFEGVRLVVTHDPLEAMTLADRIVVLENGTVVQSGAVGEIAERPRSTYVAQMVGTNLYRGTAGPEGIEVGNRTLVASWAPPGDVFAMIRPQAVSLHRRQPEGTPRNIWSGPIDHVEVDIHQVRVRVGGDLPIVAEITHSALSELGLTEGEEVWVAVKASEVTTYPA